MLIILILSTILLTKIDCHTASNSSTVLRKHTGHVDADDSKKKIFTEKNVQSAVTEPTTKEYVIADVGKDDVVFVPNERESPHTDEGEKSDGRLREADTRKEKETKEENPSIMFISGKNNDNSDSERVQNNRPVHNDYLSKPEKNRRKPVIDCTNLECNNTVHSVCGGKLENSKWKYRLFMNECYFRKVNCGFKYEINRYIQVTAEYCRNVAGHYSEKPYFFKPLMMRIERPDSLVTVRNASARRSLHLGQDGMRCAHPCPVTCTDAYEPECAVTSTGEKRVFLNHCKLDYNSCVNGILWRKQPMSECVGHRKADMTENRAFINWMQQVGIVDKKGRLSLT